MKKKSALCKLWFGLIWPLARGGGGLSRGKWDHINVNICPLFSANVSCQRCHSILISQFRLYFCLLPSGYMGITMKALNISPFLILADILAAISIGIVWLALACLSPNKSSDRIQEMLPNSAKWRVLPFGFLTFGLLVSGRCKTNRHCII